MATNPSEGPGPDRSRAEDAKVALLRTADHLRRRLTAVVSPAGLTLQQYTVLRILRGIHPGRLPTLEIGERMIETTPGVTRLLDRLERRGLIERKRGAEDRRIVLCGITDQGLDLIATLDDAVTATDRRSLSLLSSEEVASLVASLERIRTAP